jgi:hypothetical protein
MKEISREQAEQLFLKAYPIERKIEQTQEELKIYFSLPQNRSLLVVYDTKKHSESFFFGQQP